LFQTREDEMKMEMVDMRKLKRDVMRDFPEDAPIRIVILAQPDTLPKNEFIIKAMDWMLLIPTKKRR
jgi:hypothetical protein